MITTALSLPIDHLLPALREGRARREGEMAARDARFGAERVRIYSYMENIGWPELFDYRMDRWHADAEFQIAQHLRQSLFWLDNVADDTLPGLEVAPDVGWYWDMTLFGARITHSAIGVPEFLPHPLAENPDLRTLGTFDFYQTGAMPRILEKYRRMREISQQVYGGAPRIGFPSFHRGPLDIYVQLRGYENFVEDISERPTFLLDALTVIADARRRFAQARAAFLDEAPPTTTFVADDWVNVPFITPAFFRAIMVPVYARIRAQEGAVTGFHTCGKFDAIVGDLLAVFPEITNIDVSGWNDVAALDALIDARIGFGCAVINTVSLSDDAAGQREKLAAVRRVAAHRKVSVCAQAIVKLYPTYAETFARLNRFLALAYQVLYEEPGGAT